MQDENWQRVKLKAFQEGDVFIDYPFENAKFRYENETRKVFRRFYDEPEVEIPHDSELFHEAISGGWKISGEAYYRDRDAERHEEAGGLSQALAVASEPSCDVCGGKPAAVHDSAVGQKPYPRCETCVENGAENITAICLKVFLEGGPEEVEKNAPDQWWPYGVRSYDDGRYIDWPEIRSLYPKHSRFFRKNF